MPNRLDSVVNVKHLSASGQLAKEGLTDNFGAVWAQERPDGKSPRRRVVDQGHLTNIHQGHAKRSRNRRRTQGQYVHFGSQVLQHFFLLHTELLLFVDYYQAEILELNAPSRACVPITISTSPDFRPAIASFRAVVWVNRLMSSIFV